MFDKASWIWSNSQYANQRVLFFFECQLDEVPKAATVNVGCETKYTLFVNGELAVYDGGLSRESTA